MIEFVIFFTAAIASHKFVVSFCVGLELATSPDPPPTPLFAVYMSAFALVTPAGLALGLAVSEGFVDVLDEGSHHLAVGVLQGEPDPRDFFLPGFAYSRYKHDCTLQGQFYSHQILNFQVLRIFVKMPI